MLRAGAQGRVGVGLHDQALPWRRACTTRSSCGGRPRPPPRCTPGRPRWGSTLGTWHRLGMQMPASGPRRARSLPSGVLDRRPVDSDGHHILAMDDSLRLSTDGFGGARLRAYAAPLRRGLASIRYGVAPRRWRPCGQASTHDAALRAQVAGRCRYVNERRQTPAGQRCSLMCASYSSREVAQGREHRVGRRLAQRAERADRHGPGQVFRACRAAPCVPRPSVMSVRISSMRSVPRRQGTHLPHDSSCRNFRKYLATSTMQAELVHDHHAARAHHGAGRGEGLVVHRQVELRRGQAAARRPAGLHRLDGLAVLLRRRRCRR